jgi:hypothetical protein
VIIAIDFDGTIVAHEFPQIGAEVPGAFEWMEKFQEAGCKLILWTMRCDTGDSGDVLTQAVEFCRERGIEFFGVNENPQQDWSASPKAYAHVYIDDAAFGCPLRENPKMGGRPFVDWDVVGPAVYAMIEPRMARTKHK